MSYAVVRVQKMTAGSVKGIEIHDRREKDHSNTNPDIDFSKSKENYDLCPAGNVNYSQAVKERIASLHLKKAVRKDAVVMAQVIVTSDSKFFENASTDYTREFFQKAYDFLAKRYGEENVISATVHMDERTPHMHFNFVPVTSDGRLCAKDILTPKTLTEQQDAFYEQVGKPYGLQRGEPKDSGKRRTHFETAEFKQYRDAEQQAIKAVERAKEVEQLAVKETMKAIERVKTAENSVIQAEKKLEELEEEAEKANKKVDKATEMLSELKGKILTQKEVNAVKGKKTLTGALKGVTYTEYLSLKKTALEVHRMDERCKKLISERDMALEQAKNVVERMNRKSIGADLERMKEKSEYMNQNRLMKEALGISENATYDDIRRELQRRDVAPVKSKNKNFDRER